MTKKSVLFALAFVPLAALTASAAVQQPTSGAIFFQGGTGAQAGTLSPGNTMMLYNSGAGYSSPVSSSLPLPVTVTSGGGSTTLTTTQTAVTVATANTFQSIAASNTSRKGCTVQYTGSGTGLVFFGPNGSATAANAIQLPKQGTASCSLPGGVLGDNISVTSATASDTFVLTLQ